MPNEDIKPFIVAEVSKNWVNYGSGLEQASEGLLCHRFEAVIEANRQRGYLLHSFVLNQIMTNPDCLNETIIAVFRHESVKP